MEKKRNRYVDEKQRSGPHDKAEFGILKAIGEKINRDRYKLGKSVEWLGIESETSRATIRRIFDGKYNIGVITLDKVAKALGYRDVMDFFRELKNER